MDRPTFSGPRTFLQLPATLPDGGDPDVTIAGVPFDLGTTNRPGARFGPAALRDASLMLVDGDNPHFRLSPQTALRMVDMGDLAIATGYMDESLKKIEAQVRTLPGHPVFLGGDHTITLPILRAMADRIGKPLSLVHFDAHVDTWLDNFGTPVGHGTPFHHAAREGLIDPKTSIQIGIRSAVSNEIMDYTKSLGFTVVDADYVHVNGPASVIRAIRRVVGDAPAYLTFDIDGLDASQAPGTGTPEVGGLFTWQALAIIRNLKDLNWQGMDLVEVAPAYDHSQITALAGATLVWTYLSLIAAKKA